LTLVVAILTFVILAGMTLSAVPAASFGLRNVGTATHREPAHRLTSDLGAQSVFKRATLASNSRPSPMPPPLPLSPFAGATAAGEGHWRPVGRVVNDTPTVYETYLELPDESGAVAGIAWMDTRLLRATLYSGSISPGGLSWKFTAPVQPAAAKTLVAAFNGGFKFPASEGGYLSEGKPVFPLRVGAASLVIFKNGVITVAQWGRDVTMGPTVAAVRQNLDLLVDHGQPVAGLSRYDTSVWGSTLGGLPNVWRSGIGVTANGALVFVAGPSLTIVDLANLLVRAGAIRAMELDINPYWPTFATYSPSIPTGIAAPANGTNLLAGMNGSPARFFEPSWARDFITMSARGTR
jgi:hypothetical protein